MPTPRPMLRLWLLRLLLLWVGGEVGVGEELVAVILDGELEAVVELDGEDVLEMGFIRGIWANTVATGLIANMEWGCSQHSKLAGPNFPLSQQLETG